MKPTTPAVIQIRDSELDRRGVFASKNFVTGDVIEICPVIVLPKKDRESIDRTGLYDYYFWWGEDTLETAIVLGAGMLYNHSYLPNCRVERDYHQNTVRFIAISEIEENEEITHNYNGDPTDKTTVAFERKTS